MIKELTIEKTGLPVGWELTALGKVCEVIAGQSPESKFYNTNEEGLAFYQGKKDFSDKYIGQPTKWTTKITKEAIKNDILMSVRAPVGPVNFSIQKCCIGRGLAAIRASEKIDKEYLYNFLVKFENEIEGNEGAVFNSINKSQIGAIPIPLPPLSQQKQIVAILDKAFAVIDTAKANAEQNLQNAKELFESYLQNVFENKGDDWEEKTLEQISESVFAGGDKPKGNFSKEKTEDYTIPIYANAVKKRGLYGYTNKARVLKPSVTISARGSGTGHTELRKESFYPIVRLIVVVPNSEIIDLQFLKHSIDNLDILRSGSAIPQLTVPMMKKYIISYPSIEEQEKIVQKLDTLTAECKKLEAIYTQKIADLEEMKKSVLQKAFSGQLNTIN
jgi:type I restriction enzyme S subunit